MVLGPRQEWMDRDRDETGAAFRAIVFANPGEQPWSNLEPAFSKIASDVLAMGNSMAAGAYLHTLEQSESENA